ncbi:MAG: hypothetical protein Kow0032_24490 [Methyloligellaceae bacterium]
MSRPEDRQRLFYKAHARDRLIEAARHLADAPPDDLVTAHLRAEDTESQLLTIFSIIGVAVVALLVVLTALPLEALFRLPELPLH